jgi:O-succinylhomoserine sulfhydrylase
VRLLADIAHAAEAMLVVDNTYATPVLQRPLRLGADVLVYSATKFIDGQGRCCGGAIVGDASLTEACVGFLRTCGPSLSPFNAWVMLKGLETLGVRLKAACASASALAAWLRLHPAVHKVHHPSLPEHPQHRLAKEQMSDFGAVLSFEVCQGRTGAWTVIDQTRMLSITANLGDVKTTITHPATTTHGRLSDEQRARAGISEGLVRISVGLEDLEDIQVDLQRGLDALS